MITYTWKDTIERDPITHTIEIDEAALAAENSGLVAAIGAALGAAFDAQRETPRYVLPGAVPQLDAKDGVISVRATDGAVFRNGVRAGSISVAYVLLYGDGVYAKSKSTGGSWGWYWNGSAWLAFAITTELDPTVFT